MKEYRSYSNELEAIPFELTIKNGEASLPEDCKYIKAIFSGSWNNPEYLKYGEDYLQFQDKLIFSSKIENYAYFLRYIPLNVNNIQKAIQYIKERYPNYKEVVYYDAVKFANGEEYFMNDGILGGSDWEKFKLNIITKHEIFKEKVEKYFKIYHSVK